MKFIPLNDEILEILKRYADWFFEQDLTQLYTDSDTTHTQESAFSKEYLKEVMSKQMGKEM